MGQEHFQSKWIPARVRKMRPGIDLEPASVSAASVSALGWYINRLRAMSPREIVHRVREHGNRARWRGFKHGWDHFNCGDGRLPAIPQLGDQLEAAARADPQLAQRIASEYSQMERGEVVLLGKAWPLGTLAGLAVGDPALFLRDPVSGSIWPNADRYCFDIPYRHVTGLGDVKFLWEINRLQFLQVAAAHARMSGDLGLKRRVFDVVFAWMDANAPFRGPNWNSGIELSARIVTLVVILSYAGEPAAAAERVRLRAFVNAHAFWLALYPSRYSSANNHAIAEGLGLFLAGLLAPDLPGAARHEHEGRQLIETQCLLQLTADGVGVEQSPTYAAFSMEMVAFGALAARFCGRPLDKTVSARLDAAAQHLFWIMNANGETPAIGDNDEGRILTTSIDSEQHYACSIATCVTALTGATPLAPRPRSPELREALFGPTAPRGPAPSGVRTFPQGGYSIVRDEIEGRPSILVFDHGPLGYLSIAAHGHADALALWLDVAGRPVLIDAGTWLYHAGGDMRNWFRSTAAHNTVLVKGTSQSLPAGAFNWSHKANTWLINSSGGQANDGKSWWFEAAHDGYAKRYGVTHIRRVAAGTAGEIVVSDRLDGTGGRWDVAIQFLLAPDLKAVATAIGVELRRDDGLTISIAGPTGFEPRLIMASPDAPQGWISQRFGHKTATQVLAFAGDLGATPAVTRFALSYAGGNSGAD